MTVKVLGPLDTGTDPLSPRERALLSALIVRIGSPVSTGELADACWGEHVPQTWRQQVKSSVALIRGRMGPDAVRTVGQAYQFGLDADTVDAVQFERLVSAARSHALRGDHDRAIDGYRRALGLWRGEAYPDLPSWAPGIAEGVRLAEIRKSAEEELQESRLAIGEHRIVIADAERLVRDEPLREDRWAILAIANYRTDRQAEALAVLRAARSRLMDELGIEPGARLTRLESSVLQQDPSLAAPISEAHVSEVCPYRGLTAYGPDDADAFFGREEDIERLLERARPGALVALSGPSGGGKSSLMLAGLVPALQARGLEVTVLGPGSGGLPTLLHAVDSPAPVGVLAIDQAEEFLRSADADLESACRAIADFVARGGIVLATIRSDHLDRAAELPAIGPLVARNTYILGSLNSEEVRLAIEMPAHREGLRLEPGLVEVILRDWAERHSALPHLSHALVETWIRREGATLTVDGYEATGGIAGAIAKSAEAFFQSLSPEDQDQCRQILLRLVVRGADGASFRLRVPAEPLIEDPVRRALIGKLVGSRLVSIDADALVIAHEAVASAWPRLDAWLDEDVEGARIMAALASATEAWEMSARSEDDLLRGSRLQSTLEWLDVAKPDLTGTERSLLEASVDAEQAHVIALQERAARDRHQNRRLQWALRGATGLLVVAVVASGVAIIRSTEAAVRAEDAEVETLAATSLALRTSDPDVAALLAVEGYRRWPHDPRVRSALWGTMTAAGSLVAKSRIPDVDSAATAIVAATRQALVARKHGAEDTDLVLMDLESGEVVRTIADSGFVPADPELGRDVHVSGDGTVGVVQTGQFRVPGDPGTCCANRLDFFDLVTGERLGGSQLLDSRTSTQIELGDDGAIAYFVHPVTSDVIAVDTATGQVRSSGTVDPDDTTGESGRFNGVTIVDERTVAVGAESAIRLFDRETLEPLHQIRVPIETTENAMDADGEGGVVAVGPRGMARIDLSTGDVVWHTPSPHPHGLATVTVARERSLVYATDWGGNVGEYALETGESTGRTLTMHQGGVGGPVLLTDPDDLVFVHHSTPTLTRWRLDGSGPASTLVPRGQVVTGGLGNGGTESIVGPRLNGIATSEPRAIPPDATFTFHLQDAWYYDGGSGPHAFVAGADRIVPIDPDTGAVTAAVIRIPTAAPFDGGTSISGSGDGARVVVTWLDRVEAQPITGVFDLRTGEELVRGLHGDSASAVTADGEVISMGYGQLSRSRLDDLRPYGTLPKPAGGPQKIRVSDDSSTLMVVTLDQRVWLYDLDAGIRLGDPVSSSAPDNDAAQLGPDGKAMLTNVEEGVLLWNLEPSSHAEAACRLAGRELTAEEWTTYFGDEAQRRTCEGPLP